jgi:hypothetical protein
MSVFDHIHGGCMRLHRLAPEDSCISWHSHINFIDNLADRNHLLRWKEHCEIKLEHGLVCVSVEANKHHAVVA